MFSACSGGQIADEFDDEIVRRFGGVRVADRK